MVVAVLATLATIPHWTAASAQALLSDKLDAWLTAVDRHAPGRHDQAIDQVARWPVRDFDDALRELSRRLQRSEFQPLAKFGVRDQRSANALLIRAAVLHADIAIVHRGERGYSLPQIGVRSVIVGDGNEVGQMGGTLHWAVGRRALELVQPAPGSDERVKQWYQATAACSNGTSIPSSGCTRALASSSERSRAAALRRNDDEAFAEGRIQTRCLRTRADSHAAQPGDAAGVAAVGPADDELDRAEDSSGALARDPSLTEARIRLGHVLHRRSRQPNAVAELERRAR